MIGLELVAHAAPDGYTLLATSAGIQVIAPQLFRKLPFDPNRDLVPLSLFAVTQNVLAQSEMRDRIERQGADAVTGTPAAFAGFIREEWDRYTPAIKAAGLVIE
mgnify:CR=1 FL=1